MDHDGVGCLDSLIPRAVNRWFSTRVPVIETFSLTERRRKHLVRGEAPTTVVAATIGNAIFGATGAQIQQMPFVPERAKAAVAVRETPWLATHSIRMGRAGTRRQVRLQAR